MQHKLGNRSFDEILDAFGHVQRRKLLRALLIHNPQDDDPAVIDVDESVEEEFTRFLEMRHVHLPKLADYGFIVWDRETNEVSKGPNFDEIRPLLALLVDHEDELPDDWL
ncbi:transcriptional regulator [Halorubellus litoreus]|uniref:ArsR family transcriptional regulator n=1 Tax=Halorubellus litoreus TaxID=755308 RepID=A0ABD5VCV4_9EURY